MPIQSALQQLVKTRLTTTALDGLTDPLPWLSRQLLFKLHHVPANQKIQLIHVFNPPIGRDMISDLTPLKHNGSMHYYTNKFTTYVRHIGIASKLL